MNPKGLADIPRFGQVRASLRGAHMQEILALAAT